MTTSTIFLGEAIRIQPRTDLDRMLATSNEIWIFFALLIKVLVHIAVVLDQGEQLSYIGVLQEE